MGSTVLVMAAGWCAGILAGPSLTLPAVTLLVGAAATFVAAIIAPSVGLRLPALALSAFLFGVVRLGIGVPTTEPDQLAPYAGDVVLGGRLVEAPLPRGSRVEAVIEVEFVDGLDTPDGPTMLADPPPRVLLRASFLRAGHDDRVEITGRLTPPRSRPGWPLEEILERRQIRWIVEAAQVRVVEPGRMSLVGVLTATRGQFEANTRAVLPEPHASLVAGIVFGSRVGLPSDLRTAMSATGTSHLTAVSGANVAMVAGTLIFVAGGVVGRLPASAAAILGVWLYTLLVGAPPSAVRAAAMATVALVARALGRQPDAFVGLAVAVSLLLAWDPGLVFDLGFQLSVTATAGLILLAPWIERQLSWLPAWARGHLAVAIAAQVATLPLIVGTFQRISLVSLPANILAAPTIVPIMGLGVAIALLGWLPGLDAVLGWSAWLATSALLAVIGTAASLPGGVIAVGRPPAWLPALWYVVMLCWVGVGSADVRALGVRPAALKATAWLGIGAIGLLAVVGQPGSARSDGVQVVLLDTEPASAFVRMPDGRTVVLMTAAAPRGIVASVSAYLDVSEGVVDVEIGPGGLRTGIGLVDVGNAAGASAPPDRAIANDLGAGAWIGLADGVEIQVVDVRLAGEREVVDLAILVGDVAVLIPGPGSPSTNWADVAPEATWVAVLPSSAVSWARTLPPRSWLLLVGEAAIERGRVASGVPFLTRREHGSIELTISEGVVDVRSERCLAGRACRIELPAPTFRSLLSGNSNGSARQEAH